MKKSNILLIACLTAAFTLWIVGCTTQATQTNTVKNNPPQATKTEPPQLNKTEAIPAVKPDQSQYLPIISSNPGTPDAQATVDSGSLAQNPTETETPGDPPTPTLVWPTLVPRTFATPYIRPSGAHGQDLPPEEWQQWPVLPVVSDRALDIYRRGIADGHDPSHFSKVGDCQNIRQYFLGIYDSPGTFALGDKFDYLNETIDQFAGSWVRSSESVRTGFNVASVLTPLYANPAECKPGETPMACEFRLWNPSIVLISMETWTAGRPTQAYENYLRQIVEYAISQNVLPIVATKADNLEGDQSINQIVARVAHDYDIPLWNFWLSVQPITDQGLMEDGFHLTNGPNFFDKEENLDIAWPVRNLTALQVIDTVWKAVR